MGILSDQLLQAGIVTKEQVKEASKKPKQKHTHKKANRLKANKSKKAPSDLAQFYNERKKQEKKESIDAARKKQEQARIKKETNHKINALISENLLNDESAEIRYNFVVGTTIKYVFVTEHQQTKLANGELAITFLGGKRALVPTEIGKQILALNKNKIVIIAEQ